VNDPFLHGFVLGVAFSVVVLFCFLPTIVAKKREHPRLAAIFAVNLVGGWTLIGWFVALVWAHSHLPDHREDDGTRPRYANPFAAGGALSGEPVVTTQHGDASWNPQDDYELNEGSDINRERGRNALSEGRDTRSEKDTKHDLRITWIHDVEVCDQTCVVTDVWTTQVRGITVRIESTRIPAGSSAIRLYSSSISLAPGEAFYDSASSEDEIKKRVVGRLRSLLDNQ
jgi:hypothetical protein